MSILPCIHPRAFIFYLLCVSSRYCKNNHSHLTSALIQIFLKFKKNNIFMHYNEYLKGNEFTYRRKDKKRIQKLTCRFCFWVWRGCGVVLGWGFLRQYIQDLVTGASLQGSPWRCITRLCCSFVAFHWCMVRIS